MNNKPINLDRDTKLIRRYLNISKPEGVSKIAFEITPVGDESEYYMKITYLPEIDGLRAIAVGAVILYNTQIIILGYQLFKGGFIYVQN